MKVKEILKDGSLWIPNQKYDNQNPRVSILLPTYKSAQSGYFEKALNSVINQIFTEFELIIVDDCSTDETFDIIQDLMIKDYRVNCIRHTYNIGLRAISEYEAYEKSRGEYIAFMFDNNEWDNNALTKTITFMENNKIKATYGIAHLVYGEKPNQYIALGDNPNINISDLLSTNFIANASVVLRKEVIETVGLFDPHLSLASHCDWDLWRRISRQYDFVSTGIYFTKENGFILLSDTENSLNMDTWAFEEYTRIDRNNLLLPNLYCEFDILSSFGSRSAFFKDCMAKYLSQHKNKKWLENEYTENMIKLENIISHEPVKRVIVVMDFIMASEILCFNRIFKNCKYIIKFCMISNCYTEDFILVDAVILSRNLFTTQNIANKMNKMAIPCYYFVDDNFRCLYEEGIDVLNTKVLSELTNRNNLEKFRGVIISSLELLKYFELEKLHDNLLLVEPSIDEDNIRKQNIRNINSKNIDSENIDSENIDSENIDSTNIDNENKNSKISIAFMGGIFRNKLIQTCILPALIKLSNLVSITFFCPDDNQKFDKFNSNKLKIVRIPRTLSLDLAMMRYKEKEIDILIHCGENLKNNIYKTKNALINATSLGAVLLASKIAPYDDESENNNYYLATQNTIEDWFLALNQIVFDGFLRKRIYENALNLCKNRYSRNNTEKNLICELDKLDQLDFYHLNKRAEKIVKISNGISLSNHYLKERNFQFKSKPICSNLVCYTGGISKIRSYNVYSNLDSLSEIGVIFTADGVCNGTVTLSIYQNRHKLRESRVLMKDINFNDWTAFSFETINERVGNILTLRFTFDYRDSKYKLGLYENINNRTFLFKLFNKLGFPIKGINVVYFDCME